MALMTGAYDALNDRYWTGLQWVSSRERGRMAGSTRERLQLDASGNPEFHRAQMSGQPQQLSADGRTKSVPEPDPVLLLLGS